MTKRHWMMVICGSVIVSITMGIRAAFGLFIQPVSIDLEMGVSVLSLAIAISNLLFGVFQPFVGGFADRYGAGRIIAIGTAVYVAGLLLMIVSTDPLGMHLTLGVLTGFGLAATTYVVVLGAIGRAVPKEHRTTAFGITTAAGSFGMFALIPGTQEMILAFGWQGALIGLSVILATVIAFGIPLAGKPSVPEGEQENLSMTEAIGQASRLPSYWLLNAGFFVCGFHVTFIGVHLQPYLLSEGMSASIAAWALALVGLFNIFGSLTFGRLGDRLSKRYLLSFLYFARAVVIALFLFLPLNPVTALVFGAAIGFLWLATVPLTSGLVAQFFGVRYLSMLYGFVFLNHQIGSFFGAWFGGLAFESLGSYDSVWVASIVLGIAAGLIHLPIREQAAPSLSPKAA